MKVATSVVVPVFRTLHAKSNSGRQRIETGVLVGGISGSVVRSQRLTSEDALLESTTSKVLVVFEGHADDDENLSWTTDFFYLPRSRTIPKVV